MREYKFRAWDKHEKRMIYSDQYDHRFIWIIDGKGIEVIEDDGTDWNYLKDLKFMQYTGPKDKNGKEIYEGDIVKAKEPYKLNSKERFYTCEVVFTDGALFMLKHKTVKWGKEEVHYYNMRIMEIEVIGNIYENPELLEENK